MTALVIAGILLQSSLLVSFTLWNGEEVKRWEHASAVETNNGCRYPIAGARADTP